MYFNNFRPGFPSTLPSFGAVPVGGGFRPSFGFGGAWGGMNNWLGNQFMGFGCQGMSNWFRPPQHRPGWSWQNQNQWNHGPGPSHGHRPVGPQWPSQAPSGCHVPRTGHWDAGTGGYKVGASGELKVEFGAGESSSNNLIEYRAANGEWTSLGYSKDQLGKSTTIQAPPGSTVEFRIKNSGGDYLYAGTDKNKDGRDHGKVTQTGKGFTLGFEDWTDSDFNDSVIRLSDPGRRR